MTGDARIEAYYDSNSARELATWLVNDEDTIVRLTEELNTEKDLHLESLRISDERRKDNARLRHACDTMTASINNWREYSARQAYDYANTKDLLDGAQRLIPGYVDEIARLKRLLDEALTAIDRYESGHHN